MIGWIFSYSGENWRMILEASTGCSAVCVRLPVRTYYSGSIVYRSTLYSSECRYTNCPELRRRKKRETLRSRTSFSCSLSIAPSVAATQRCRHVPTGGNAVRRHRDRCMHVSARRGGTHRRLGVSAGEADRPRAGKTIWWISSKIAG